MANHIAFANFNIFGGVLEGRMEFGPGLNIVSGENGTLKTQMLQALRGGGQAVASDPSQALRMQVFSPKRNSERRAVDNIVQFFRQNNRTWDTSINERINAQINTTGFDTYNSLADLYYLLFEYRAKDGLDRHAHMTAVAQEFNEVIGAVFPNYRLLVQWDSVLGSPRIKMQKAGNVEFPVEALSMGEQEVLSLILNISTGMSAFDVYLIDEPEVHLNWHLEERLFSFLDDLCENHAKQAIVVTHSRTIFKPRFFEKAQFLSWGQAGKVEWSKSLSAEKRRRLAGDAVEIIALGDFSKLTFFVEDSSHALVLEKLAQHFQKSITVSPCGNSNNVISLFKFQLGQNSWPNSYFIIDGDNQGNPFPNSGQFIHLPYYCIENFLLDIEVLASALSMTPEVVQNSLLEVIKAKRSLLFKQNKFFAFLVDSLVGEHLTFDRLTSLDGSVVVPELLKKLGAGSMEDFLPKYIEAASKMDRLNNLLPETISSLLSTSDTAALVAEPAILVQAEAQLSPAEGN